MFKRVFFLLFIFIVAASFRTPEVGNLLYYKGKLGSSLDIQMNIEIEGPDVAKGSYIVESTGEVFVLRGEINKASQHLSLTAYNQSEEKVAEIEAFYYVDTDQQMQDIEGLWKSADGQKVMQIKLQKIAEVIA